MDQIASASAFAGLTAAAGSFGLIFLAEIGDKSQLVCMALAARHSHRPVFLGAIAAFVVLNILAVVFGAGLAHWVPERVLAAVVAILFAVFGVLSLRAEEEDGTEEIQERSGHGIFATTFLMIFLAEMGDRPSSPSLGWPEPSQPFRFWIGATLALGATSALGIVVGRKLLRRVPCIGYTRSAAYSSWSLRPLLLD